MTELTNDNLNELVKENEKVLVQYGAAWCGSCRMVKPKFKKLAESTEGVAFFYVDAEKYPESRQLAEVNNLPTFAYFEGGELKSQVMGTKFEKVEEMLNAPASH
jgi:thiol-disulfide isomerase/thioredoxin